MSNWIKCSERLPECPHECTSDHTMVSQTVLVTCGESMHTLGMAHMREDGTWLMYGGDHDFMNPDKVVYWMPLPATPYKQARAKAA